MAARPSTRKPSSGSGRPSARADRRTSGTSGRAPARRRPCDGRLDLTSRRLRVGQAHVTDWILRIARHQRGELSRPLPQGAPPRTGAAPNPRSARRDRDRAGARAAKARSPRRSGRARDSGRRGRRRRPRTAPARRSETLRASAGGAPPPHAAAPRARARRRRPGTLGGGLSQRAGGVEVEPARAQEAGQQEIGRPPGRGRAAGPARIGHGLAGAIVVHLQRGQRLPGARELGIDGHHLPQIAAGGVARERRRAGRIVARELAGQCQPDGETGAPPGARAPPSPRRRAAPSGGKGVAVVAQRLPPRRVGRPRRREKTPTE